MRSFLLLLSLLCLPVLLTATHNRAGEIIVRSACDGSFGTVNRACATIITYTETAQTDVDRDTLVISWGDNSPLQNIGRTLRQPIGNGIQRNEYRLCHTYPGAGRYFISFQDQNRVAAVLNIDGGSSVNIPFSVYTSYTVTSPLQGTCNNSPELTQIPIENACVGSIWTHNPGAFDVDGDSLAFEFTTPQRAPGVPIANYVLPNEFGGRTGSLTINERTGQITWNAPAVRGEYNLAFLIKSFRNGSPLDTLVRDMQIFVEECNNDPPTLDIPVEEICVVAGDLVEFDVIAGAPITDTDQQVRLQAIGRPFDIVDNRATFTPNDSTYNDDPFTRNFRWRPNCSQISDQPYIVVFRAEDDFFERFNVGNRRGGLSTLRAVSIKVVAPPPEGLELLVEEDRVTLTWDKPYGCEEQADPEFLGFEVYRRIGSNPFVVDTCETGLQGRGYTKVTDFESMEMQDGRYVFVDEDIQPGRTYCYRVVALFGRVIPATGFFSGFLESIPSEEVCAQLPRDIPLLIKVDVLNTDATNGRVQVCWVLPQAQALDTLLNPGPYRYVLSRAEGQTGDLSAFTEVVTLTTQFFNQPVDSCLVDTGLNTEDLSYSYSIELFVGNDNEPLREGQPASTVRLEGAPTDEAVDLTWAALVPWTNFSYDLSRRGPGETTFSLLTTTPAQMFRDEGLENEEEYCYLIEASGTYNVPGLPAPLLNTSQEFCITPFDNVAPCAPELTVESPCDRPVDCTIPEELFNSLSWTSPALACDDGDVAGYRIYFSTTQDGDLVQVAEASGGDVLSFNDFPETGITGCYRVTAVDLSGNESEFSNQVCVVNCPVFELPNAFTPNGDRQNDVVVPISRCFVDRIQLQIFNRWGQLVFETEDPAVNWDGTNEKGEQLASGTYYYVGTIFEQRLEGITTADEPISGFIELVRGE